jgi:copper transport protein
VSGRTTIGDVVLRYTVDPARIGLNQLNLYLLEPKGRPYRRPTTIAVELGSPDGGDLPRRIRLERLGPGHYVNSATEFDAAGVWRLKVQTAGTSRSASDIAEINLAIG